MNLHSIANGAISAVNPNVLAVLKQSTGYLTMPDGERVPQYSATYGGIQLQPMSSTDLRRDNFVNIQGVMKSAYLDGNWSAIIRSSIKSGDVFVIDGHEWKVIAAPENWPDWSKVALVLQ